MIQRVHTCPLRIIFEIISPCELPDVTAARSKSPGTRSVQPYFVTRRSH